MRCLGCEVTWSLQLSYMRNKSLLSQKLSQTLNTSIFQRMHVCFFVVAEEYRVKYLFRRPVIPFTFEFFVGGLRTAVTPSNSSTVTRNCCSNTVKYLVKPHWDVSST